MRILLLSAYDALSHRYWREGLVSQLDHIDWVVLSLPPRFFRFRVRGNPLSWVADQREVLEDDYDLVIATSLVDISTLRGLIPSLANTPLWVYCHENQFAYPPSADKRHEVQHELEAKMVFLYALMSADAVSFNSRWNRQTAIEGIKKLMAQLPEKMAPSLLEQLQRKSDVLPVPLLPCHSAPCHSAPGSTRAPSQGAQPLRLLWNHRWEYDKGPDLLLAFVQLLGEQPDHYQLNIVGQQFRRQPEAFAQIKAHVQASDNLTMGRWGFVESRADYLEVMTNCDIVLSTALHDFQGVAVLEAAQYGLIPLLPDALVYPEIFADQYRYTVADDDRVTAQNMLARLLQWGQTRLPAAADVSRFEWSKLRPAYQAQIDRLLASRLS